MLKGAIRAALTMRELENAKRSIESSSTGGLFMRVTLVVIYMYLIVISYSMLGTTGVVFITILFMVALFVPFFYQVIRNRLEKRRSRNENHSLGRYDRREG